MEKFLVKFIQQCADEYIEDNMLNENAIGIVDNYSDYIVEKLEIFFDRLKKVQNESDKYSQTRL